MTRTTATATAKSLLSYKLQPVHKQGKGQFDLGCDISLFCTVDRRAVTVDEKRSRLGEVCMATTFFVRSQKPRVSFFLLFFPSRLGYGGLDLAWEGRAWGMKWNLGQWTLDRDRMDLVSTSLIRLSCKLARFAFFACLVTPTMSYPPHLFLDLRTLLYFHSKHSIFFCIYTIQMTCKEWIQLGNLCLFVF